MKLGKTLIITGLLFSSVLGSVNVNNITAMAAENNVRTESGEEEAQNLEEVKVNYDFGENSGINVENFMKTAKTTAPANLGATTYDLSNFKMPDGFEVVFKKVDIKRDDGGNNPTIVVAVREKVISEVVVTAKYYDKDDNIISDSDVVKKNLPLKLVLKDAKGTVEKDNLKNIPDGFEFVKYENAAVVLKETEPKPETPKPTPTHGKSKGGHSGYARQRVRISFIDQDGNEAGYQQLNGKDTFSAKIVAPTGYSFVNEKDAAIKFDKTGNKDIKIKITKNKPTPVMSEGIVTTNSGEYFHLYTIEGKDITNRGLSGDSKWYTDQYATINGEKMYRVATNEWVKATDVYK